jgi:two-component system OmpR family sensor kinase
VIRRRLVALILLVVAAVTGAAGVLMVNTLHHRLVTGVDRELEVRSNAIAPQPPFGRRPEPDRGGGGGDGGGGPRGPGPEGQAPSPFDVRQFAFVSLDAEGNVVSSVPTGPSDNPDPLPDLHGLKAPAGPLTVPSVNGGKIEYRVVLLSQPGGGAVAAGIPLTDVDRAVDAARGIALVAWVFSVALTGMIVWITVRRSLRPIGDMITTAERIAGGELSERTSVPHPASEVGHLGIALNAMLDRIEEAVDAKTASEARTRRFAADASHELRTPLTSIRGYAELYRHGARTPEEVERSMARIEHEAVRMGDLVEDLLLLARLDQGRPLEREPVDLTALVLDAVVAARAIEPDRPIDVAVGDDQVSVAGDRHRLRQVVDNLLTNVREHTPVGTRAEVRLSGNGPNTTLVVADDGPGMTAEEASHAFDRFWQAGGDTGDGGRGTGLGLAIVSEIVAAHGGTIRLDTEPGAGARFTITLPAVERERVVEPADTRG